MAYRDILKLIGSNIKRIREHTHGFSLNYTAKKSMMEWKQLSKIESGKSNLTIKTLCKIADVLQVPVYDLCKPNPDNDPPVNSGPIDNDNNKLTKVKK
jgi:transcriptional regulator with XRE-family HTH domain